MSVPESMRRRPTDNGPLSAEDAAIVRSTCGTTQALEFLASCGLVLAPRDLAKARSTGEVPAQQIGGCWRYRFEALQDFANRRLGAFPEIDDPEPRESDEDGW